jgi:hypothetical protein
VTFRKNVIAMLLLQQMRTKTDQGKNQKEQTALLNTAARPAAC